MSLIDFCTKWFCSTRGCHVSSVWFPVVTLRFVLEFPQVPQKTTQCMTNEKLYHVILWSRFSECRGPVCIRLRVRWISEITCLGWSMEMIGMGFAVAGPSWAPLMLIRKLEKFTLMFVRLNSYRCHNGTNWKNRCFCMATIVQTVSQKLLQYEGSLVVLAMLWRINSGRGMLFLGSFAIIICNKSPVKDTDNISEKKYCQIIGNFHQNIFKFHL